MSNYPAFGTQTNREQNPLYQQMQGVQQSQPFASQQKREEEDSYSPTPYSPTGPSGPSAPRTGGQAGPTASGPAPAAAPSSPVTSTGKLNATPAVPWGGYQSTFQQPLRVTPSNPQYQHKTAQAQNANEQVLGLYQRFMGRSASLPEVQHWVNQVGGGATLTPEQLKQIETAFTQSPEGAAYKGFKPALQGGQFIPGVTLGQTLQADPAGVLQGGQPTQFTPQAMTPRPMDTVYQGYDFGPVQQAPQYRAGQFQGQMPTYGGSTFGQFTGPQNQQVEQAGQAGILGLLQNPNVLSPEQINQLKASQQEAVNEKVRQAQAQLESSIASRGLSGSGGAAAAGQRRVGEAGLSELTKGFREIDLQAAQLNDQGRRSALDLASGYLSGQMNRATQGYGAQLAGQEAQAQDSRAQNASAQNASQFGLQAFGANEGARQAEAQMGLAGQQFTFNQLLARAADAQDRAASMAGAYNTDQSQGLNRDQLGLQAYMAERGLNLDETRLGQQNRQFNQGMGLDFMRFLEDRFQGREGLSLQGKQLGQQQGQFNSSLAYNYDRMNADREQNFLNMLFNSYGG